MGYRVRLGKVKKIDREEFRDKSVHEVLDIFIKYNYEQIHNPTFHEQLFELGKYVDFNKNFEGFYDFNIYEEFEVEFQIMKKEDLKRIIQEYHEIIWENYINLLKGEGYCLDDPDCINDFLKDRVRAWSNPKFLPYRLDESPGCDGEIAKSW